MKNVIDLLMSFAKTSGVSFTGIRNYTNSNGETANVVINIGANFQTAKEKDIEFLKNLDVKTLGSKINVSLLEEARKSLIGSLISPAKAQSEAQKNAYTVITNGLKVHNESGKIYIFGLIVSKQVLTEGIYPTVNSSDITLAKKAIQKELKSTKFRQYVVENVGAVRMNGETLEF